MPNHVPRPLIEQQRVWLEDDSPLFFDPFATDSYWQRSAIRLASAVRTVSYTSADPSGELAAASLIERDLRSAQAAYDRLRQLASDFADGTGRCLHEGNLLTPADMLGQGGERKSFIKCQLDWGRKKSRRIE